jgi:hypothetical protein
MAANSATFATWRMSFTLLRRHPPATFVVLLGFERLVLGNMPAPDGLAVACMESTIYGRTSIAERLVHPTGRFFALRNLEYARVLPGSVGS